LWTLSPRLWPVIALVEFLILIKFNSWIFSGTPFSCGVSYKVHRLACIWLHRGFVSTWFCVCQRCGHPALRHCVPGSVLFMRPSIETLHCLTENLNLL
jgi:hypothetical protein